MSTPHVSGIVALMLQKDLVDGKQDLTAAQVEIILENTALPIDSGTARVINPLTGMIEQITWGSDATGAGLVQADDAIG